MNGGAGLSWDTAFSTLDAALSVATEESDEIWLLYNTTYYPLSADRMSCFETAIGVAIYGGFVGNESYKTQRPTDSNHYELYPSIISGNINDKSINTDNCYHVITYQRQLTLDGVTISDGYADLQMYEDQTYVLHKYGGALITFDGSDTTNLHINNVRFINNYALNGGALWFMSTNLNQVSAVITNSIFINNHAFTGNYEGGYGGAIYLYFEADISIANTQFIGNSAQFKAGAIYQDYGGILSCDGCKFFSNIAGGYGGALFAEDRNSQTDGTFPVISSSQFYNNSADIYGGAICWFNDVVGTLFNNTFTKNHADNYGGAIAVIGAELTDDWRQNTYIENIAILDSTTNDFYSDPFAEYDGVDTTLDMNVTYYLNILWSQYNDEIPSEITNIYPYSSDNIICYVDGDNVGDDNKTGESWISAYQIIQRCINDLILNTDGGEIWVKSGVYNPTEVPLWKQDAGLTDDEHKSIIMYENIRIYGGFDGTETNRSQRNFFKNPSYLSCDLGTTYCNEIVIAADNSLIDGFVFIKAQWNEDRRRLSDADASSIGEVMSAVTGLTGGGIYSNSTTITVVNSVFYQLFAKKGGAIYCIGLQGYPSTIIKAPTIINTAFYGNRASYRGGAISGDVSCNFECLYCIFDSNSCSKKGGAIYLDFDSDPIISHSLFMNNYALESGGCLANDGVSNTTFVNTQFINNYASWEGGCLYSGSGAGTGMHQGFVFDAVEFSNNHLVHANKGQNDTYLWPYNILKYLSEIDTESSAKNRAKNMIQDEDLCQYEVIVEDAYGLDDSDTDVMWIHNYNDVYVKIYGEGESGSKVLQTETINESTRPQWNDETFEFDEAKDGIGAYISFRFEIYDEDVILDDFLGETNKIMTSDIRESNMDYSEEMVVFRDGVESGSLFVTISKECGSL